MSTHNPQTFDDIRLSPPVRQAIAEAGYDRPTEVQAGVVPLVLAGLDLIVQSQTGSGKTAAFGIPIAEMLDPSPGRVQAMILTPTRELALQVTEEVLRVGARARALNVVTIYGGASISDQIRAVKTAEVIVATPGRILDLLRRKATSLESVRLFVLDEADEMLSMGFEREVRDIVSFLPEDRQSLMFSATVTESIRDIAADLLSYPEFVSFSSESLGAEEVEHYYYMVTGIGRLRDLQRVLQHEEPSSALIFCNTRDDSFRVSNYLKRQGYDSDVLNGDLPQTEREQVMAMMKAGRLQLLVATDIAARGIDISFLPCVINFMLPESAEAYVHRTGRTGRAGRKGVALSLISPKEIGMFYQLRRAYKFDLAARTLPKDEELVALRERRGLERLLDGLDAAGDLAYGACLPLADSFFELADRRTRLAKLMAFFVRERDRQRDGERQEQRAPEEAARAAEPVAVTRQEAAEIAPAEPQEPARVEAARPEAGPEREPARGEAVSDEAVAEAGEGERRGGRRRGRWRKERREGGEFRPAVAPPESVRPEVAPGSNGLAEAARTEDRRRERRASEARVQSEATVPQPPGMTRIRVNLGRDRVDSPDRLVSLLAELSGLDREDLGAARLYDDHALVDVRDDLADDIIQAIHHERIGDYELLASR